MAGAAAALDRGAELRLRLNSAELVHRAWCFPHRLRTVLRLNSAELVHRAWCFLKTTAWQNYKVLARY